MTIEELTTVEPVGEPINFSGAEFDFLKVSFSGPEFDFLNFYLPDLGPEFDLPGFELATAVTR
jgi:hypothetical protein